MGPKLEGGLEWNSSGLMRIPLTGRWPAGLNGESYTSTIDTPNHDCLGFHYKALYRNCREPAKSMDLVVEGTDGR